MSGTLALGGSKAADIEEAKNATVDKSTRNERWQKQPFYGEHQSGILTPQQSAMMLVAFDVLASNKIDLIHLFKLFVLVST